MISARPSAVVTYLALACCLGVLAGKRYRLSVLASLAAGGMGASLHLAGVLVHHAGHALAARLVGHPMTGVRLWGGLGTSIYPDDEPPLPDSIHMTRAIGGPLASLLVGAVVASVGLPRGLNADFKRLVVADNLIFLGLGSFLPLGFTDGSTLLQALRSYRSSHP